MLSSRDEKKPNPHSNEDTQQIYSDSHQKIQAAFGLLRRIEQPVHHAEPQSQLVGINDLREADAPAIEARNDQAIMFAAEEVVVQEAVGEVGEEVREKVSEDVFEDIPLSDVPNPTLTEEAITEGVKEKSNPIKVDTRLNKLLGEFFQVQRDFHSNMSRLVDTITKNPPSSYQLKLHLLDETIKPFKILANNPFMSMPTGNDVEDMTHIMQVMDQQNHEFDLALRALADSVSRTRFTSAMLKDLQRDEQAFAKLKAELGCTSTMVLQGYFDKPMQNLCRYMLLLTTIKQELEKTEDFEAKRMLSGFIDKIESLSPQIKNINENLDSIILLSSVEHTLKEMLELSFVKAEQAKQAIEDEKNKTSNGVTPFADDITLCNLIKFTIDCTYTGKIRIVRNEQDYYLLFTTLLEQMKEIDAKCTALEAAATSSLSSRTYYYTFGIASATYSLFFSTDTAMIKTPQEELKLLINKFTVTIGQIEAVRALQAKAMLRSPSQLVQ